MAKQTVCREIYGDNYLLEPSIHIKSPKTSEDFAHYKYVLPSAKICRTCKHDASLTKEQNAAEMILSKVPPTKVTVQFDSTQRSRIPGDWPAIILIFMKEGHAEYVPLRPIYFAFEDRGQIVSFFIEP